MTLLNAKDLGITLGMPLFSNLNFSINKGDHIGLVAANGRGKSTLLNCLAGWLEPTEGDITHARGLKVGYVEQNVPEDLMGQSLYDAVLSGLPTEQAEYESWRVDVVLDDLAVPIELHARLVGELSGGWQRVMLLARVWVGEPDLLLMDEPTNHLDLSRIGFLQNWLGTVARDTPILVASHDRAFLDAVTNRTLFLREDQSQAFALSYSQARAALDESDAAKERQYENDARKAQQLRRQAAKLKNIGVNSGSDLLITKTKQLKERADKIEQQSQAAYKDKSAGAIKLVNSDTHAKALITLEEGDVTAPDGKVLFKNPPLWIKRGDRIVLLGRNGTGKTQLIRMVQQAVLGEHPTIKSTPTVVMGYSDQALSQLDDIATPQEVITERFDVGDQRAIALLAGAGINLDMQSKPIGALSGGQKSRLAMLDLRLRNPNFYLLDEPTNHLDIEGQEALEEELQAHNASCLLVSHDRAFVRNTGTRYWLIENKRLKEVDDPEDFFSASLGEQLSG